MRDSMKACQHTLSDDVVYKDVVVIGNGPSGMVASFMLAGNVPHLKAVPQDLPIDDMLRARLSNLTPGQSLYETDLAQLAEGLEGRSQNPIPLLMDNLLRPCADIGVAADSLIEWTFDIDKQIEHIVLGRGPPGGAWHTFPPSVRTLSPAEWLSLPPHHAAGHGRLSARAVAKYCRRYVHACKLQRYFRCGVVVTSVRLVPRTAAACGAHCTRHALYCVSGYDIPSRRPFRYQCRRVVLACGSGDRPNSLEPQIATHAVHSLADVERAVRVIRDSGTVPQSVLIVGSGVSAADCVRLSLSRSLRTHHAHRDPAQALARLPRAQYPDYCQVYEMMRDGISDEHPNYVSYSHHSIVDVTPLPVDIDADIDENNLRPKRVTLLDLKTNETTEIIVSLIAVLIGSKPDLFFLQTNFNLNSIDVCTRCTEKHASKRKIEDDNSCFLKNHWYYFKSVVGQSIRSCKSRYLNTQEINGNDDTKCIVPDCVQKCSCKVVCECDIVEKCACQDPYANGIGFGIDPNKPVDGRGNPIAIDKGTHELLNSPKGLYALGPLTADNFVRFIPGGALAIVAHMHKEKY